MAEPRQPADGDTGPQARARDGLDHLQTAARELIAAARAMLDVVEDVVAEPESVTAVAGLVGDFLRQGTGPRTPEGAADGEGSADAPPRRARDDGEVQRITVR